MRKSSSEQAGYDPAGYDPAGYDPAGYDPAFVHARREAGWILLAWLVCLCWTVGVSAWAGYAGAPEVTSLILGIPRWVLWGVVVPWLGATAFSVWFALYVMADDDLGGEEGEEGHA